MLMWQWMKFYIFFNEIDFSDKLDNNLFEKIKQVKKLL